MLLQLALTSHSLSTLLEFKSGFHVVFGNFEKNMTNNGNYWCKRQDRNMMKTCSIFQRSPLGFQALCYLETDRNIIRQQKYPIYVFNNIRKGKCAMGILCSFGRVLRDLSSHGQGPSSGTELKDFLPTAPLLNQIIFFLNATSKGPHPMSNYLLFCLLMFSFSSVDRLALTV